MGKIEFFKKLFGKKKKTDSEKTDTQKQEKIEQQQEQQNMPSGGEKKFSQTTPIIDNLNKTTSSTTSGTAEDGGQSSNSDLKLDLGKELKSKDTKNTNEKKDKPEEKDETKEEEKKEKKTPLEECKKEYTTIKNNINELLNGQITHTESAKNIISAEREKFNKASDRYKYFLIGMSIDTYKSKAKDVEIERINAEDALLRVEKKHEKTKALSANISKVAGKTQMKSVLIALKHLDKNGDSKQAASTTASNEATSEDLTNKSKFYNGVDKVWGWAGNIKDKITKNKVAEWLSERKEEISLAVDSSKAIIDDENGFAEAYNSKSEMIDKGSGIVGATFGVYGALKKTISCLTSAVKYIADKRERKKRGDGSDSWNERWRKFKSVYSRILDIVDDISNVVAPIKELPVFSVVISALKVARGLVNTLDGGIRMGVLISQKKKLWDKMEEKKKKYESRDEDKYAVQYYDLNKKSHKINAVREKRDALREALSGISNANTSKTKTKNKIENVESIAKVGDFTKLSEEIVNERKNNEKEKKKGEAKKRIRLMEALEILNQYYTLNEAHDRQIKVFAHGAKEAVAEGIRFTTGLVEICSGGIAFPATRAVNLLVTGAETMHSLISFAHKKFSGADGREEAKKNRRKEMAETLVNSLDLVTTPEYGFESAQAKFNLDGVADYKLPTINNSLQSFDETLFGVDINLNELVLSKTKEDLVNVLSASFSEEQEVED